jgi:hypothetical protein
MTIFRDIADEFGGELVVGSPSNSVQQAIYDFAIRAQSWNDQFCRSHPGDGSMVGLRPGITRSPEFNAFATIADGHPLIGINAGLLVNLHRFFDAALASPETLPSIGNIGAEQQSSELTLDEEIDIETVIASGPSWPLPRDPVRAALAGHLRNLASDFVYMHEFGHLAHGHVDWLQATSRLMLIDELNVASSGALSGIDLQTLEMDADSVAANNTLLRTLYFHPDPNDGSRGDYRPNQYFPNAGVAVEIFGFVTYAVFRKFFTFRRFETLEEVLELSHPPGMMRSNMIMATAMEVAAQKSILSREAFAAPCVSGSIGAEGAFRRLSADRSVNRDSAENSAVIGGKLTKAILRNWHNLYPDLAPVVRAGRLAPPQEVEDED